MTHYFMDQNCNRMVNPKYKLAIGLEYEENGEAAPRLGVKGENLIADEVVKVARRFGIPVVEKADLAKSLTALELEEEIPESLYQAVAVILNEIGKKG